MSGIIDVEKRYVFPKWRTYADAKKLGELDPLKLPTEFEYINKVNAEFSFLTEKAWKKKKTVVLAADILNFASMHNLQDSPLALDAARFLTSNKEASGSLLIRLANQILKIDETENEEIIFDDKKFRVNISIHSDIRRFKAMVRREPKFAVGWVELARSYSILSQTDLAKKCIETALHITNSNRFVIRSATRFFIHLGEYDKALSILKRSSLSKTDPWVVSAIIALNSKLKKQSNHFNRGLKMIDSGKFTNLETSELASALGTVEYYNGKFTKATNFWYEALVNPTDNSFAQVCWYSQPTVTDQEHKVFLNAHEASTIRNYRDQNFEKSFNENLKWIQDEPFSTRPILTASYNSSVFLEKHKESAELAKLGLEINPKSPELINNLIYDLILSNQMNQAEEIINDSSKMQVFQDQTSNSFDATKGLYHFRKGNIKLGRELYLGAISNFKKNKQLYMEALAFANYAYEEVLAKSDLAENVYNMLNEKYGQIDKLDIKHLIKRVTKLYNKNLIKKQE